MIREELLHLNCIVSGRKTKVAIGSTMRVGALIMRALDESGHGSATASEWQATDADGLSLVRSNSLVHSDLEDGDVVYIDPKPGVGA